MVVYVIPVVVPKKYTTTLTTGTTALLYSPTSTPNTIFCSNAADWLRRHKTVLCQEVIVNTRVHNLQINETQIELAKIHVILVVVYYFGRQQ